MERERIKAIYDERAPTYDRTIGLAERLALGLLRREFGASLRGETLEVAIGSGLNLPHYGPAVTRAVGVDLSEGMLAQAAARARDLSREIELRAMDAERLDFPDASFDTVAISLALCTAPDPSAVLRELGRVCKPEGRVVLLEHVVSPLAPVAWLERRLSPWQVRRLGCHLDRASIDLARSLRFGIVSERQRLAGVLRLVVASPPVRAL